MAARSAKIALSYENFPSQDETLVRQLIQEGLRYTRHGDIVTCDQCQLDCGLWANMNSGTTPADIHRLFAEDCPSHTESAIEVDMTGVSFHPHTAILTELFTGFPTHLDCMYIVAETPTWPMFRERDPLKLLGGAFVEHQTGKPYIMQLCASQTLWLCASCGKTYDYEPGKSDDELTMFARHASDDYGLNRCRMATLSNMSVTSARAAKSFPRGMYICKSPTRPSDLLVERIQHGLIQPNALPQCHVCNVFNIQCVLNCGHTLCHTCAQEVQVCSFCRATITHRITLRGI